MSSTKQNVWQNIIAIGKNILAHVNINYDGSTGAIRIDIIPTEYQDNLTSQRVIPQESDAVVLISPPQDYTGEETDNLDQNGENDEC